MIPLVFITALNLAALAIADLAGDFSGSCIEALFPGSAGFEGATGAYNRRFTFTPSAIAYPKSAEDVSKVVTMGGGNGMKVVARSGGGRALPHGTCPYVGIGGHSAFGGFGYTSRMWGLTIDTIKAVNTVLANGTSFSSSLFPSFIKPSSSNQGPLRRIPLIRNNNLHRSRNLPLPELLYHLLLHLGLDIQTTSQALLDLHTFVTNTSDLPPEFGGGLTLSKGTTEGKLSFTLLGGWYGSQGTKLDQVLAPFLGRMPNPDNEARLGNGTYIDSVKELGGGVGYEY
ncbi:hypothetical protein PQX77_014830 [Marasmius sp. AFHP31]|nr:hypothetical protein PQX77_014830 [Marasmius sp. AFHP31]